MLRKYVWVQSGHLSRPYWGPLCVTKSRDIHDCHDDDNAYADADDDGNAGADAGDDDGDVNADADTSCQNFIRNLVGATACHQKLRRS